MSVFLIGSTGLVGSEILSAAIKSPTIQSIQTLSRLPLELSNEKIRTVVEKESSNWCDVIKQQDLKPRVFISSFGSTKAKAGGSKQFHALDYGIPFQIAKSLKESNETDTVILISSAMANSRSPLLYLRTKGELEDDIKKMDFNHAVFIRPGVLLGQRKEDHGHWNKFAMKVGGWIQNTWLSPLMNPINAEDVGKVAVHYSELSLRNELRDKLTIIEGRDLIKVAKEL